MCIHRKSYILFRISYIFTESHIFCFRRHKDTESYIYCSECHIYHRKSYKVAESNNTISSLFYKEKDIFVNKN